MVHGASGDYGEIEVFEVDVNGRRLIPDSTVGADHALFISLSSC